MYWCSQLDGLMVDLCSSAVGGLLRECEFSLFTPGFLDFVFRLVAGYDVFIPVSCIFEGCCPLFLTGCQFLRGEGEKCG